VPIPFEGRESSEGFTFLWTFRDQLHRETVSQHRRIWQHNDDQLPKMEAQPTPKRYVYQYDIHCAIKS